MKQKTAAPVKRPRNKVQTVPIDGEAFIKGLGNLTKAFEQNSEILKGYISSGSTQHDSNMLHNQAKATKSDSPAAIEGTTDLSTLIRVANERAGFLVVYSDELRQRIVHGGVEPTAEGSIPNSMSYGPNKDYVLGIHTAFGIIARNLDDINTYLLAQ
jgi:hypothetical protein